MLTNITYNENYFRGKFVENPSPAGYGDYNRSTHLLELPDSLVTKFINRALDNGMDLSSKKVLVFGCAYGFLVEALTEAGVDAYGIDISNFALTQAPTEIAGRLLQGDIRQEDSWEDAKTLAGLTKKNDKFDMVIDEDTLCCFTDAEAMAVCDFMSEYGTLAVHLIEETANFSNWYNYHTIAEWVSIIGFSPKEKWYRRYSE